MLDFFAGQLCHSNPLISQIVVWSVRLEPFHHGAALVAGSVCDPSGTAFGTVGKLLRNAPHRTVCTGIISTAHGANNNGACSPPTVTHMSVKCTHSVPEEGRTPIFQLCTVRLGNEAITETNSGGGRTRTYILGDQRATPEENTSHDIMECTQIQILPIKLHPQ